MIPTITEECLEFLRESKGNYLVKNLPKVYMGFTKVKVRINRKKTPFIENFNRAFEDTRKDFYGSSIFAYSDESLLTNEKEKEPFYIFPVDGYKFVYNPQVLKASEELDKPELKEVVTDLVTLSYKTSKLNEALSNDCEIIVYGVPYYYAVRKSLVENYYSFFYEV
jgi:hypothetical protein